MKSAAPNACSKKHTLHRVQICLLFGYAIIIVKNIINTESLEDPNEKKNLLDFL